MHRCVRSIYHVFRHLCTWCHWGFCTQEDKLASVDQGPVLTESAGADAMVDSLPDLNKTADQAVTEGGEPGEGACVATDEANVSL